MNIKTKIINLVVELDGQIGDSTLGMVLENIQNTSNGAGTTEIVEVLHELSMLMEQGSEQRNDVVKAIKKIQAGTRG